MWAEPTFLIITVNVLIVMQKNKSLSTKDNSFSSCSSVSATRGFLSSSITVFSAKLKGYHSQEKRGKVLPIQANIKAGSRKEISPACRYLYRSDHSRGSP